MIRIGEHKVHPRTLKALSQIVRRVDPRIPDYAQVIPVSRQEMFLLGFTYTSENYHELENLLSGMLTDILKRRSKLARWKIEFNAEYSAIRIIFNTADK